MTNILVFDSCGPFDEPNPKHSSSTGSTFYKYDSTGKDNDDDSLWNGVISDEPESRGSIGGEDTTLAVTNRGYLSKPNVTSDETTLGSLISTDIGSSNYDSETITYTSAGEKSLPSAPSRVSPVILFCEQIKEIEEDVMSFYSQDVSSLNSRGESGYGDSTTNSCRNTEGFISAYQFVPAAPFGVEKQSFGVDGPSYRLKTTTSPVKRISSGNQFWEGIRDSSSSLVASVQRTKKKSFSATWGQNGSSIGKQKNLAAMVNKMKTKSKKVSQKLLSFRQSSECIIAGNIRRESTVTNNEQNEYVISGGQHQNETATEELHQQQSTWRYGKVQLVKEKFIPKPDYRGRLNMKSNMEEFFRSVDSDDCRHFVVDISSGFEVVPPQLLK